MNMEIGDHSAANPTSMRNDNSLESVRRSVTYHPSVWGDYFLAFGTDSGELSTPEEEQYLQRLKEEVRQLLDTTSDDSLRKLDLIDAVHRLGLAYQFEEEIQKSLDYIYNAYYVSFSRSEDDHDLFTVALRFRLLRQQGYHVPCDVFAKFKNLEGKFEDSLIKNVEGLYEAAHFAAHGEEILDEALGFCKTNLESFVRNMSGSSLAAQVDEALKQPIHKMLTVLGIKKFMSIYQEDESHNQVLLNFSKLHFNKLQKMYQKELSEITRWWKALDFEKKLPFARDGLVECYFWVLGIYFEPQYRFGRMLLSKLIQLASVLDDIYDVQGTFDELQLFTDAIERWDVSATHELPPYMRDYYKALLDVYAGAETELGETNRSYYVQYAIEEMKILARTYFEEAKWVFQNHIPSSMEEYMKVAVPSAGYVMVATTALVGMENLLIKKEELDWVSSEPLIVRASGIIARLMDDIVGHQSEKKSSAVECYMKEHGASKDEAFHELKRLIWNAWKDINQECLNPTRLVSMHILNRILNCARVIYFLYKDGDGYTNSKTKTTDLIKSVLVEPTPALEL
uniref:Putative beta-caryophyllene synthase n=1 Tax=Scoparia dulcis TaxID=107240 RepID=A0A5K7XZ28_SCODU|nr:putative beta-caryophyllene synthase [Scoparia dulcis]